MEAVGLVVLGRCVPATLLGDGVHDHRAAEGLGPAQRVLQRLDVVAVDRPDVLEPEVLEQSLRGHDVLDALLDPVQRLVGQPPGRAAALQHGLAEVEHPLIALGGAQGGQPLGQATDGRGVGTFVVVDDDDEVAVAPHGDVVQRLPRHAAGQGAVTDDRDDVPVGQAAQLVRLGQPVGPGQGRRGVAALDDVVLGLGARRVTGETALLLEVREVVAAGDQLVHVRLVTGVPDDLILR